MPNSWVFLEEARLYKKHRVVIICDCTVQSLSKLTLNETVLFYYGCHRPNERTQLLRILTTSLSKKRGVSAVVDQITGIFMALLMRLHCVYKSSTGGLECFSWEVGNEGLLQTEWTEVSACESCVFHPNSQWSFPTYPTSWPLTGARRVGMLWVSLESHVWEERLCVFWRYFFKSNFNRTLN